MNWSKLDKTTFSFRTSVEKKCEKKQNGNSGKSIDVQLETFSGRNEIVLELNGLNCTPYCSVLNNIYKHGAECRVVKLGYQEVMQI